MNSTGSIYFFLRGLLIETYLRYLGSIFCHPTALEFLSSIVNILWAALMPLVKSCMVPWWAFQSILKVAFEFLGNSDSLPSKKKKWKLIPWRGNSKEVWRKGTLTASRHDHYFFTWNHKISSHYCICSPVLSTLATNSRWKSYEVSVVSLMSAAHIKPGKIQSGLEES